MATLADYLGPELASTLPPPNYVNPQTDVPAVLGTEISLTALMIIFVGMRFYSRLFVNRLFGADGRSGRLLRRPHGHNLRKHKARTHRISHVGRASETDTGWLQVDVHEHFAVPSDLGVDEDQCLFGVSEAFPGKRQPMVLLEHDHL